MDEGEVPIGAVIARGKMVLAADHNRTGQKSSPLAHAELLVLEQAIAASPRGTLEDCTLYVTLEPCPMCAGAILNARVGRVVYILPEGKSGAMGSVVDLCTMPFAGKTKVEKMGDEGEVLSLMRAFFEKRR